MAEAAEAKPTSQKPIESVVEEEEDEGKETMKPWEQHSAVISIPRFDYKAPSSLLQTCHSGFLITCPIKREKSATKEAISILQKHVGCLYSSPTLDPEGTDASSALKKRKLNLGNGDGERLNSSECTGTPDEIRDFESEATLKISDVLSLVKLTRSGLVLFTFPRDSSPAVIDIVLSIIISLESGTLNTPLWCHRIFPIQATCSLEEKELHRVVSKLVKQFVSDNENELPANVKFAVGYNRRGIEETEMKDKRSTSSNSNAYAMLDRKKCFSVVAAAVVEAAPDSVVDLSCPTICILIELLPLSAVPDGSLVVGVSVLPQKLVSLKPKLCIKALISDTKDKIKK